MTRENKLALVIGFGLILFIGILISDHFSVANNQTTADLTERPGDDPMFVRNPQQMVALVPEIYTDRPEETPSNDSQTRPGEITPPADEMALTSEVVSTPDLLAMESAGANEPVRIQPQTREDRPAPPPGTYRTHHLADRETLTAVSQRYYGTAALADAIAQFNGIADPNKVRAGHRLNVPDLNVLVAETGDNGLLEYVEDPTNRRQVALRPEFEQYEIQSGDMLSKLASRYLGTGKRWKELYDLNKDVIDDPDKLIEGVVIRIPTR